MPGSLRYYLSRIDAGGRIVVMRSDGQEFDAAQKRWFDNTITKQLRAENAAGKSGTYPDAVLTEPDVEVGINRTTGEEVTVHPLVHKVKRIILLRGFRYSDLSVMLGRNKASVSSWIRGLIDPKFRDMVALYGTLGYKIVPVPFETLPEVMALVEGAEEAIAKDMQIVSMGDKEELN